MIYKDPTDIEMNRKVITAILMKEGFPYSFFERANDREVIEAFTIISELKEIEKEETQRRR